LSARPDGTDAAAFSELETLVRNLGEELASFRKRAQTAEQRLQAIATRGGGGEGMAEEGVAQLEAENAKLRQRLADASARTGKVLDRVRFLRQQHEATPDESSR
jgi:predicted  nucleic acid-binding Zn-ribbon protein